MDESMSQETFKSINGCPYRIDQQSQRFVNMEITLLNVNFEGILFW